MNYAIAGIVIIGVMALLVAANISDPSAVGSCITVASGAAGALGGCADPGISAATRGGC